MKRRAMTIADALERRSLRLALSIARNKLIDSWTEWGLGIRTSRRIEINKLIPDPPDEWHDYAPTSVQDFLLLMKQIEINAGVDVFIDVGSGQGRVLALAGLFPFKKIVGIEVSKDLCEQARKNLSKSRAKMVCKNFDIWEGNADCFQIPADSTIFYFFNPFHGETLERVFHAIRNSVCSHPRDITIIFNNCYHLEKMSEHLSWLKQTQALDLHNRCIILKGNAASM